MGNILHFPYGVAGATLYARITDDAGNSWYTTTPALEAYNAAHFAAYAVPLAQEGASGDYTLTVPAALPAGAYTAFIRLQAGGSAVEDPTVDGPVGVIGLPDFIWDGASLVRSTGDAYARLGAPAGASVAADLAEIEGETDALLAALAAGVALTVTERNAIADALLDRVNGIEAGLSLRNAHRLIAAVLCGKVTGAEVSLPVFRNALADTKNRVSATTDAFGNRSVVTTDLT